MAALFGFRCRSARWTLSSTSVQALSNTVANIAPNMTALGNCIVDPEAFALVEPILPFDNLHIQAIEAYWRSFYDCAASFALTQAQLRQICCRAAHSLDPSASSQRARKHADRVFEVFLDPRLRQPQQQHQLAQPLVIDALEFLSAIAFVSVASLEDKIDLIFDSWDMSEDGALDLDELTISLKSTLTGLARILKPVSAAAAAKHQLPSAASWAVDEDEVDALADRIFREIAAAAAGPNQLSITCEQFREYCTRNKTAKSLLAFFELANVSVQDEDEDDAAADGEFGRNSGSAEANEEANRLKRALLSKTDARDDEHEQLTDASASDAPSGDEFLAVKPWKGAVVPPSQLPPLSRAAPLVSIQLDWIFGYSAQGARNNVRYVLTHSSSGGNSSGGRPDAIVYPAAAACVVLDTKTMKQRHLLAHTDDVLCVCLHPKLPLAASGELGRRPKLLVWDLVSMDITCVLQGFHQRGVLLVAFLSDERLVSVGGDDDHSVGVYESSDGWRSATLAAFARGNKAVPFHLAVSPAVSPEFVVCGQKSIEFWTLADGGKALRSKKALVGKKGTLQPFLVAEYVSRGSSAAAAVVVGTNDGHLYLFRGSDLASVVKAHTAAVNALHWSAGLLVSGSKDGTLLMWDDTLKQAGGSIVLADTVLASGKHAQYLSVRSCCLSPDKSMILLGTQASEIYEIDARTGQSTRDDALARGHFHGELWGLDVHPHKQQCCTVGDDQSLRIWDLETKRELRAVRLEHPGRACAYSGDGKLIAVGIGSNSAGSSTAPAAKPPRGSAAAAKAPAKAFGGFVVYRESDLAKVKEPCVDPKKWVSDVKFSPDNRVLAVASHDSNVYLYDVLKGFAKQQVFKKHSSYVTHVDFSSDGTHLQSTCGAYELLFSEVATAKHLTGATAFRDERWHTMTTTLGWAVQGIWEAGSDGTDVNALDRSKDGELLATGDDVGKVKLFRYPCALEKAACVELRGHGSHVTNVRWSPLDHFLVSVGGNDRCVFVWKHETAAAKTALASDPYLDEHVAASSADIDDRAPDTQRRDPLALAAADDDMGDEFMAVKPWLGAVVPPSNASSMKLSSSPPDARLELECVHGYQAQNASNNARYDASGKIVYHAAALGVVFDKSSRRQRFFKSHDDDIVALCAHPNGAVFATAQMGKRPKIYTWDAATGATLACLEGFHQRFVSALCFSSDGKKLGSVGGDDDHSVAVYSWESGVLAASAKGERSSVAGMCFHPASRAWVTCGDKHIRFWTEQGANLTSKKAIFGKARHKHGTAPAAFECVAAFGQLLVAGASNGDLYVFQPSSNALSAIVTAHASNAYAMCAGGRDGTELVTGGKDAKIMVWDLDMRLLVSVDLQSLAAAVPLYSPGVRSVCASSRSSRLFLVGTSGSDLLEVDASVASAPTASVVTRGHCVSEVWGLACHPTKAEYCTAGDDQTLRVWCLNTKCQLRMAKLECAARVCAIAGPLDAIAVGYGAHSSQRARSKASQSKTGSVVLLRYSDLATLFEDKPSKQPVSAVQFSPNGKVLAVGAHDHHIYLYKLHDAGCTRVTRTATFAKHQSYITHLDFSSDSATLQSTCGAYELLFSDAASGRHLTAASSTKDTSWQTWTCVLGWPVQGIWPPGADGTDVNAAARNARSDLLATADDFGLVKLFRYPCVARHAGALEHRGHASHVTNVRWSAGDAYVVSVGGNDRCVMEWKVVRDLVSAAGSATAETSDDGADDEREAADFADDPAGDEFLAVKPWLGAIVPPSNAPAPNPRAPDLSLALDWVYGYQTELSRQNLVYNDRDEIVYHTAAVGVIYDPVAHLQRHHVGHTDDILSFAVPSAARSVVATGERGKKPVVRLWDARSGELRCELKGVHARGVVSLAFSADRKLLASVGDDDDHSVALWEDASNGSWTLATLRATAKGDKGVNHFAAFAGRGAALVTGGAKHVLFWTIEGKALVSKRGRVGPKGALQLFPCGCAFGDEFVTGAASGELYVWRGDEVAKVVKAHEGEASVVYAHDSVEMSAAAQRLLLSGGKDGKVLMWNASFQSLRCFDLAALNAGCLLRAICSVDLSASAQKLLVGTKSSDIVEVDVSSGVVLNGGRPLFSGHFTHELWGLAVHPSRREFTTTGDDGTLRVWDMDTKHMTRLLRLPAKARACAYSPDAALLAIGLGGGGAGARRRGGSGARAKSKEGAVLVLSADAGAPDARVVFEDAPAKEWISDVKFSPCGSQLAFGSHDNAVYLYAVRAAGASVEVTKRKAFAKHNSYITHLDFSADSTLLQSNCGAYEYLFCDAATSEQVRSATAVRNTAWATWTCTLGWPVQGIWPECADGTDINAVCASGSRTLLAAGDDSSLVKIFRFPCTVKGSKFVSGRGHSSHVTNVRFSYDDKFLLSTGGNDRSVFQWKLS
ncbi:hypothetical protein PybrP1_010272 [[Pythium] brassicae (nom. inval.)]|nr:hypothetical protein PybrP1_010272 [[Pythium] brassicae (nom. inval.)]